MELQAQMARDAQLVRIRRNNPGKRFASPEGFFGNRPFYQEGWQAASARGPVAFMLDPEGWVSDRNTTPVTPFPTGPIDGRFSASWDLPALTGDEIVVTQSNWQNIDALQAERDRLASMPTIIANGKLVSTPIPAASPALQAATSPVVVNNVFHVNTMPLLSSFSLAAGNPEGEPVGTVSPTMLRALTIAPSASSVSPVRMTVAPAAAGTTANSVPDAKDNTQRNMLLIAAVVVAVLVFR